MAGKGRGEGRKFEKGDPRAGRPPGVLNKVTVAVREVAQGLVDDPVYRASLQERLNAGQLAPAVETMLWHYAHGKPKETVELMGKDGAPFGGPQIILTLPENGRDLKTEK